MDHGDNRLIIFDLETGGLDPKRHPIIQLAAVAVDADLQPHEAFEVKIQFEARQANRNSLRKNHYAPGVWSKLAVPAKDAAYSFANFLRRHATIPTVAADGTVYRVAQLIAHNAAFDGPFLQAWFEKLGVFLPARRQVLCTLQRAMWLVTEDLCGSVPPKDFKLATLCQYFGVPFHAAAAHEALSDVTATLGLYRAIREVVPANPRNKRIQTDATFCSQISPNGFTGSRW
jgi:DNA polymerase III epsilon subunit-like protein